MDDFEFDFLDRVQKIRSMNDLYNLEAKSFVSFSGGKDSTVLSELIDIALPNNRIPRVYIDTGIDYKMIREFVHKKSRDGRANQDNQAGKEHHGDACGRRLSV